MENLLVLNIRGLNSPTKQQELQVVIRNLKVGLLGIVETKLTPTALDICKQKWFQDWGSLHNGGSRRFRIWLLWDLQRFQITHLMTHDQWVHVRIIKKSTKEEFYMTVVYGFNQQTEREQLWEGLNGIAAGMTKP